MKFAFCSSRKAKQSRLFVRARGTEKSEGIGALEEKRLLAGGYDFPELETPTTPIVTCCSTQRPCYSSSITFVSAKPIRCDGAYLVFPELINLKRPLEKDAATEDGASYTVTGPTENVFASLVVLLGYTHTFTRTAQWQNNARYEVSEGSVCGFRQDAERDGELDFVLCFAPNVGQPVRTLFQGLFESFLARRNLTVQRYEPVRCSKHHLLNRAVVREAMQQGDETGLLLEMRRKSNAAGNGGTDPVDARSQVEVESQRRPPSNEHTSSRPSSASTRTSRAEDYPAGVLHQLR